MKKARVPLTLAATWAGTVLLGSLVNILLPVWYVIFLSLSLSLFTTLSSIPLWRNLLNRFFSPFRFEIRSGLTMALSMMSSGAITGLALPHLFLAMNALPLAASLSILSLAAFISVYEHTIHSPRLELGNNYSLIKFLMNPRKIFQVIRHIVKSTYRPQTAEGLRLPEASRRVLIARQTAAIDELEKSAIIDDAALYKKHYNNYLRIETESLTTPAANQNMDIVNKALVETKAEAATLEAAYINTLANFEQITNYKTYRELTRNMSPLYAECSLMKQSVWDNPPQDFVVLEQRFTDTGECVNANTLLFHYATGYLPLFQADESAAQNPFTRELLFEPETENGRTKDYYFYTYQIIHSHGLSLKLCESIEKLNLSLKQAPARKPAKNVSHALTDSEPNEVSLIQANSAATIPDYRSTAPANLGSTSKKGVFSPSPHIHFDDPSLVDLALTKNGKKTIRSNSI